MRMQPPDGDPRQPSRNVAETRAKASEPPNHPLSSSGWARVRAALITLTILVGLADGCPIPTPQVMERLPPSLQTASLRLNDAQRIVLTPFSPIKDAFTISQRWALFSTTGGTRYRMWIEANGTRYEPWTLLYRAGDDAHRFLSDTLEYRRVRNVWNPSRRGAKRSYAAFCSWIAHTIFEQDSHFQFVRVSMERGQILEKGAAFVPSGEFTDVTIRRREDVFR
jgi:hypothetical protein